MKTILSIMLPLMTLNLFAQGSEPGPPPGNTCADATQLLKKDTFTLDTVPVAISSSGITPTCFDNGPANSDLWYSFEVSKTGSIEFKVTPLVNNELDWALYDITDGCPDLSSPNDVADKEMACNFNFSGPGNADPVGMLESSKIICPNSDLSGSAEKEFCQSIELQQCRKYGLMIENFSGVGSPTGYKFELGGSMEVKSKAGDTCTVGIDDYLYQELNVYPNPAENSINISHFFDQTSKIKLVLFNSVGQKVFQRSEIVAHGNWTKTFNVGDIAAGVYIVRMDVDKKYFLNKLVVK